MTKKVLIIDDEAEIRRNLTVGLTQEGYAATACPDGISAIHELDQARSRGILYDYLVTDIFMPDIDGLKILKVIKNFYPELPVLVITGFGDDNLKFTALSEENTGYLDKPFEMPDLVAALDELVPGTTLKSTAQSSDSAEIREAASAYLTIRITNPGKSMDIYSKLMSMPGVQRCDAVRGEFDIIILAHGSSKEEIKELFEEIASIEDVEILSLSSIERPKLDRDVNEFIDIYSKAVKSQTSVAQEKQTGTTSYVIVDIEPAEIQQIFTTVFFIDDVIFCDVIESGKKLVGMITGHGAVGKKPKIIEKLSQIDGVLRVREAAIINLVGH